MKKRLCLTAMASSVLTCLALAGLGWAPAPAKVKLENVKVKVTEITFAPGVPRERHIRAHDQVIVFLDDCRYERTDSTTKEKTFRERKSGDVIWHDRGEDAPRLVNAGSRAYRTIVVELLAK